jgi:L-seryl-tRNA(Ser) seleniumtransferase
MMRALRVDKLTLAALAATLRLYRDPAQARTRLPLLRLLSTPEAALRVRAERIAEQLTNANGIASVAAEPGVTYLGGGSVPAQEIATWCIALTPQSTKVDEVAMRLRNGGPSIVARIQRNALMLDLRSVFESQDELLVHGVRQALQGT